jgi:hypothetical protein
MIECYLPKSEREMTMVFGNEFEIVFFKILIFFLFKIIFIIFESF